MQYQVNEEARRSGGDAGGGGGGGAATPDVLSAEEVRQLRQRFSTSIDQLVAAGSASGLSGAQVSALRAGETVPLEPGQRSQLEPMLRSTDAGAATPEGVSRQEIMNGAWSCNSGTGGGTGAALQAPTGAELSTNPTVAAAIEQAWTDSQAGDAANRHEEGGWIYMDTTTGAISVRRAAGGARAGINMNNPPEIAGSVVVGNFHTHPNLTSEGWEPGPSPADTRLENARGVPGVIRADDGIHVYGPARRASLTGNAGYP